MCTPLCHICRKTKKAQAGNKDSNDRKGCEYGSESLFFGSLIATYMVYRGQSTVGPFPHGPDGLLDIPLTPNVLSIGDSQDGPPDQDPPAGRPGGAP